MTSSGVVRNPRQSALLICRGHTNVPNGVVDINSVGTQSTTNSLRAADTRSNPNRLATSLANRSNRIGPSISTVSRTASVMTRRTDAELTRSRSSRSPRGVVGAQAYATPRPCQSRSSEDGATSSSKWIVGVEVVAAPATSSCRSSRPVLGTSSCSGSPFEKERSASTSRFSTTSSSAARASASAISIARASGVSPVSRSGLF